KGIKFLITSHPPKSPGAPTAPARRSRNRPHECSADLVYRSSLLLEELVGHAARALLAGDRCLEPSDLLGEKGDAFLKLLDREQCEILPDLVHDLFLRAVVVIHYRHRSPPLDSR